MYLRGSKWSMTRRRKRSNPFLVTVLLVLVGVFVYVDRVVVPATPPLFIPTPTPTRAPETYVVEAESFYAEGKLAQAIGAYQQAVIADPNNPANFIALARLQVYAGRYNDALANAGNALLLNPNNSLAHALRGWALGMQDPPNYLEAEGALKKALDLDQNNALAHAFLAEILGRQQEEGKGGIDTLDRAIAESRTARDLGSDLLEVHRARGYIHTLVSEYDEAVLEYTAAIEINENIPDLHISLGKVYVALELYSEAVEEYTRANSLNPTDPNPDFLTSRTLARIGEFAQAVQYAEEAAKDAPDDPQMLGNLGSMYYKDQQFDRAVKYLGLAIRGGTTEDGLVVEGIPLDSSLLTLEFYNRYGLALANVNQCSEAVRVAELIIQGVPSDEISVSNAQEMINICQANLGATPDLDGTETPEVETTPTP